MRFVTLCQNVSQKCTARQPGGWTGLIDDEMMRWSDDEMMWWDDGMMEWIDKEDGDKLLG
jgi:hypothetical protein